MMVLSKPEVANVIFIEKLTGNMHVFPSLQISTVEFCHRKQTLVLRKKIESGTTKA